MKLLKWQKEALKLIELMSDDALLNNIFERGDFYGMLSKEMRRETWIREQENEELRIRFNNAKNQRTTTL